MVDCLSRKKVEKRDPLEGKQESIPLLCIWTEATFFSWIYSTFLISYSTNPNHFQTLLIISLGGNHKDLYCPPANENIEPQIWVKMSVLIFLSSNKVKTLLTRGLSPL